MIAIGGLDTTFRMINDLYVGVDHYPLGAGRCCLGDFETVSGECTSWSHQGIAPNII